MALGDLRFSTKFRIHGAQETDHHGLAMDFTMSAPTGNEKRLYGAQGFTFQPRLLIDGYLDEAKFNVGLGFVFRPETEQIENVELSHEFIYSAGVTMKLDWASTALVGEVFGAVPMTGVVDEDTAYL